MPTTADIAYRALYFVMGLTAGFIAFYGCPDLAAADVRNAETAMEVHVP